MQKEFKYNSKHEMDCIIQISLQITVNEYLLSIYGICIREICQGTF